MSLEPAHAARVAYEAVYGRQLDQLAEAFARHGLSPLLVKGQALVDTVYPRSAFRPSGDIDLLVPGQVVEVTLVLTELGYTQVFPNRPVHFAPWIVDDIQFRPRGAGVPVEVKEHLDKMIRRPVDYRGIVARRQPSPRPGLSYPAVEDHLLLVVLHASCDVVGDPARSLDDLVHLVHEGRPDAGVVRARAAAWGLERALGEWLHRLARERGVRVPGLVSSRPRRPLWVRPARLLARPPLPPAVPYLLDQIPRHDSQVRAAAGALRYLLLRGLDSMAARVRSRVR